MEKSIKGTRTEKNLLKAFAGESQAKNRYEYAAKVAKEEGYEQIAGIFLATALQEQTHAKRFFRFLEGGNVEITASYPAGKIDTTKENPSAAAEGEHEEWSDLYPAFARIAEDMGCVGIRVERPQDLKEAFNRALKANKPVVIDVVSDEQAAPAWA